ncbi:MAG TPA: AmmeMemoRadiSam system radical SAM enzyme [Spirillospora sp.]|nr:AmmeMemoRadiSam system radical SAM enzyme [Spirillospora sp.]
MKEAALYTQLPDNRVRCELCAHRCRIADGRLGACRVRKNVGGTLYSLVYGRLTSQHIDPIEKKPLFHFYPGSRAYSIATPGCNFRCRWCQNWQIAQIPHEAQIIAGAECTPEEVVEAARAAGCQSIAYTYTEPTVFFEFTYDAARYAHQIGLYNIYVTNGFMTREMLALLQPYLDAANVDLKAFRESTYRRFVGAHLQPVLDSLIAMKKLGIWLEVTTLLIPEINDEPDELRDIARFIVHELGADIPWHVSRFYPAYRMADRRATPPETLKLAQQIGIEAGLKFVYIGNYPEAGYEDTRCPACQRVLIHRRGFFVAFNEVTENRCPNCGTVIAGRGLSWNVG